MAPPIRPSACGNRPPAQADRHPARGNRPGASRHRASQLTRLLNGAAHLPLRMDQPTICKSQPGCHISRPTRRASRPRFPVNARPHGRRLPVSRLQFPFGAGHHVEMGRAVPSSRDLGRRSKATWTPGRSSYVTASLLPQSTPSMKSTNIFCADFRHLGGRASLSVVKHADVTPRPNDAAINPCLYRGTTNSIGPLFHLVQFHSLPGAQHA